MDDEFGGEFEIREMEIDQPTIEWDPEKDISSYELAKAVPVLFQALNGDLVRLKKSIEELPDNVSRHFNIE